MIQKISEIDSITRIHELLDAGYLGGEKVNRIQNTLSQVTDFQILNLLLFSWEQSIAKAYSSLTQHSLDELSAWRKSAKSEEVEKARNIMLDHQKLLRDYLCSSDGAILIATSQTVCEAFRKSRHINIVECLSSLIQRLKNLLLNFDEDSVNHSNNHKLNVEALNAIELFLTSVEDGLLENINKFITRNISPAIKYTDLTELESGTHNLLSSVASNDELDNAFNVFTMIYLLGHFYDHSLQMKSAKKIMSMLQECFFSLEKEEDFKYTYDIMRSIIERNCTTKMRGISSAKQNPIIIKMIEVEKNLAEKPNEKMKSFDTIQANIKKLGFSQFDDGKEKRYILEKSYSNISNNAQLHKFDLRYKASLLFILYGPIKNIHEHLSRLPKTLFGLTNEDIEHTEQILEGVRVALNDVKEFYNAEFQNRIDQLDQHLKNILSCQADEIISYLYLLMPKLFEILRNLLLEDNLHPKHKILTHDEPNEFLAVIRQYKALSSSFCG